MVVLLLLVVVVAVRLRAQRFPQNGCQVTVDGQRQQPHREHGKGPSVCPTVFCCEENV